MAISGSGALSGAATGASTGAFFGPIGAGVGAGIGGLLGLFSGKSLSKEEKRILQQLELMAGQQSQAGQGLLDQATASGKKYDTLAHGVRSGANAQVSNYWSSLLGGDRAKMQSATSPARAAIADTYRGGRKSLDRSNVRGAQRQKAEAELGRQETGQLAGLVQGVQPMAAQELAAQEAQIQQIMTQYFGLGEQAKSSGAYAAATMMGNASNNYNSILGAHTGLRGEQSANDRAAGGAFGSLLGPAASALSQGGVGFGRQAPTMNNRAGSAAPTPSGWTLPRPGLTGQGGAGMNYFNATTTPRNPWSGVKF